MFTSKSKSMKAIELNVVLNEDIAALMEQGYTENEANEILSDTYDEQAYRFAYDCI